MPLQRKGKERKEKKRKDDDDDKHISYSLLDSTQPNESR